MLHYLLFAIRCLFGRFRYFKLSPRKKAKFLIRCNLYFEAGNHYRKIGAYQEAVACYEKCQAYRQCFYCYEKLGQVSKALQLAEQHKLYKMGAELCMRTNNPIKAASFYRLYKLPEAIKIYKRHNMFYELGHCYLHSYRFQAALGAFLKCEDPYLKADGLKHIDEIATVHYLQKQYQEALKLFEGLGDDRSSLACATALKDKERIAALSKRLATSDYAAGRLSEAAYRIAPYSRHLARLFYHLEKEQNPELLTAFSEGRYLDLITYCFHNNNLHLAQALSRYWCMSEQNPLSA